ncbi:carbamoyltransferase HypF [Corynebacterium sp. NPDC060344]|uniref:carbamoyltransferase HypF n=1 Tax=Corynebacterium sp. NPDC060344 TaxID=3347101 RepID=UPI0036568182
MSDIRREHLLRGVIQGVGFRPHVAAVAARHAVSGFCGNDDREVFIEVQGESRVVDAFIEDVLDDAPPLSHILAHEVRDLPLDDGESGFTILDSRRAGGAPTLLPPDVATCPDCLAEMRDPADRRFGYPFITCVNCGPRLTIIEDVPYDRPNTTMREFPMCPACAAEYADPGNRRHHAQPISCFDCGPRLWLEEPGSASSPASVAATIARARALLDDGAILAVKGIGGFHLMCDAANDEAVAKLRRRKHRPAKPFAVMVPDATTAERLARFEDAELALLTSPAHPIVIAPIRAGTGLAPSVAPGLGDIGVMVAYSPLHELVVDKPLVATSGNPPGEALCHGNAAARARLGHIADAFLLHDRGIHVPVEDSVFLGERPVRRSRGVAPLPLPLPFSRADDTAPAPVLAVGGELKNTFAVVDGVCGEGGVGAMAHVSPHIGDMRSAVSQATFGESVERMLAMRRVEPGLVIHDLHPDYATTAWAERFADDEPGVRLVGVQHHYAHALSLLAEHGIAEGPAVVAALDGTGYGTDGTIWGGEILTLGGGSSHGDLRSWSRTWHVPAFDFAGGDRSVERPWRTAVCVARSWGLDAVVREVLDEVIPANAAPERALLESQLAAGVGVVASTSLGRIFDAAAVFAGCGATWDDGAVSYEAQAAMEFEHLARTAVDEVGVTEGAATTIPELFEELAEPGDPAVRALRFHVGLARIIGEQITLAAETAGTTIVGVTGGCALNRILVSALREDLAARGLALLEHRVVPANDGGLAVGQAMAGLLASRTTPG